MAGRIAAAREWLRQVLDSELSQLSRGQAKIAYLIKLVIETWRELKRDQCFIHASALAYKTLLSLVPFVVIVMAVSSGSLLESYQEPILDSIINSVYPLGDAAVDDRQARDPGEKEDLKSATDVREFTRKWLRDRMEKFPVAAGKTGGVISLLFLMVIVIFLMVDIERSFNLIWGVTSGRPVVRKVASYTAVLFWGTVLMLISSRTASSVKSRTAAISGFLKDDPAWQWVWDVLFRGFFTEFLLPFLFLWLVLLFVYTYMPNTRVKKRAAATGGALAALLLYAGKGVFQLYVVNMVSYDRVYGTLSVIPVTLVWLYLSWVIILFGAEVGFTIQNFEDLAAKDERERRGIRLRLYYAVRTVHTVCLRFVRGESPKVLEELAREFQIAEYALRSVVSELVAHGMLARVEGEADAFVPAKSPETMTVKTVIDALHGTRFDAPAKSDTMWIDADPVRDVIHELFRRYERAADEQLGGMTFADLASKVSSRTPVVPLRSSPTPPDDAEADADSSEKNPADKKEDAGQTD